MAWIRNSKLSKGPCREDRRTRGGSDDIGDVSWNVPTVTLRYPSNIPNLPGHNWSNAITMATPIAHKGVTAGAKVLAMTMVDLLTKPAIVEQAWDYFRTVQTKETKYQPLISAQDQPAIWLNKKTMDEYRAPMRKFYYNPRHLIHIWINSASAIPGEPVDPVASGTQNSRLEGRLSPRSTPAT